MACNEVSVLFWNVGFARLGQPPITPVSFIKSALGLEAGEVSNRCNKIAEALQKERCDLYALQELCSASILNSWVPVRRVIGQSLPQHTEYFFEDFRVPIWNGSYAASHGQSIYSTFGVKHFSEIQLPQVKSLNPLHRFKRATAGVVRLKLSFARQPITLIGVHLSAIDDKTSTKRKQIDAIFEFSESEFLEGRYVLICGDFNFCTFSRFRASNGGTLDKGIPSFPRDILPRGWTLSPVEFSSTLEDANGVDAIRNGCLVDGLILSPNLVIEKMDLLENSLALSDHPAIKAHVRLV